MADVDHLALAQAHMVKQVRDAGVIQLGARTAWTRFMNPNDLDGSFSTYLRAAVAVLQTGRARGTITAEQYFAEAKRLAGLGAVIPKTAPRPLDLKMATEALFVNGPVLVKTKIAEGASVNAAMTFASAASLRTVKRLTLEAPRSALIDLTKKDADAVGWARVSDGKPCHFCAMLVGRGPVYSEQTVRFEAHNGCGCAVRPFFKGDPYEGWSPDAKKLRKLWDDTGDLKSFRSAYGKAIKDPDNPLSKTLAEKVALAA